MKSFLVVALLLSLTIPSAATANDICNGQSRPDCAKAIAFFDEFQHALAVNDRERVASMARYPLRMLLHGKSALIRNRAELLREYDTVFDSSVLCAIQRAKRTDVWGNWQGFTVAGGPAWWEREDDNSPFKLITVNNGAYYKGCGNPKNR